MAEALIAITQSAHDQDVLRVSNISMADAFGNSNGYGPTGVSVRIAYQLNVASYQYFVGLLRFDTSSLGAGTTVSGAKLRFYCIAGTQFNTTDVSNCAIQLQADWSAWTGSSAGDWANPPGSLAYGPVTPTSALFPVGTVCELSLNNAQANVNTTGTTYLRLGFANNGTNPTTFNRLLVESFDGSTAGAIKPTLVVDYYQISYDETMRPTGVSGLTNLTGAFTDIDQDPDGTITDAGLVAP